jgi:hypothetical protein
MSATIHPFIRNAAFGPEAVAVMGDAYDRACAATAQAGEPPIVQEVIATCIIELAKTGERQPQVLCDRALEALGLPGTERFRA